MSTNKRSEGAGAERRAAMVQLGAGVVLAIAGVYVLIGTRSLNDIRVALFGSAVALIGVGVPQFLGGLAAVNRVEAERREAVEHDLDETRRVCLIALATPSAGTAATVINAAAFHHSPPLIPMEDASELLGTIRQGLADDRLEKIVNDACERLNQPLLFPARQEPSAG